MISTIPRHEPAFLMLPAILKVTAQDLVLDCTLGDGGHTQKCLETGAKVISIDCDEEAIERSKRFIPSTLQANWIPVRENFSNLTAVFSHQKFPSPTVVIMDLGTSQFQLACAKRGFSFRLDAPLDMRLDNRLGVTAADLVNALPEKELAKLFVELGDESYAGIIAKKIVKRRLVTPFENTLDLADLVKSVKHSHARIHEATKVFQSLRMAVNLEREALLSGLTGAFELLHARGRMAVISFHSGEDKIVKQFFKQLVKSNLATLLSKKYQKPESNELLINPKIRSAKLRIIEKY